MKDWYEKRNSFKSPLLRERARVRATKNYLAFSYCTVPVAYSTDDWHENRSSSKSPLLWERVRVRATKNCPAFSYFRVLVATSTE